MTFRCIADDDTVRGFRLAGVEGEIVATPAEAAAALDRAVGDGATGVVILTRDVANGIRERVRTLRRDFDRPLVVEIPGPLGGAEFAPDLARLVQAAVGIRLETTSPP